MDRQAQEEDFTTIRTVNNWPVLSTLLALVSLLFIISCSQKHRESILLRDHSSPPEVIQEAFARQGKSDYFLLHDEGYAFRLIYLCENRVLNFIEEPKNNPVLVSIQPILDTAVEKSFLPMTAGASGPALREKSGRNNLASKK